MRLAVHHLPKRERPFVSSSSSSSCLLVIHSQPKQDMDEAATRKSNPVVCGVTCNPHIKVPGSKMLHVCVHACVCAVEGAKMAFDAHPGDSGWLLCVSLNLLLVFASDCAGCESAHHRLPFMQSPFEGPHHKTHLPFVRRIAQATASEERNSNKRAKRVHFPCARLAHQTQQKETTTNSICFCFCFCFCFRLWNPMSAHSHPRALVLKQTGKSWDLPDLDASSDILHVGISDSKGEVETERDR